MMGYGEDKGIIPMAGERIFHKIDANEDPDLTFRVETSMLESMCFAGCPECDAGTF